MKHYIDGLIVVEGKTDLAFLKSFLDVEIVITNGFDIFQEDFNYILRVSKTKKVIILSDSDDSGYLIRKRLNEKIPNAYNALVDISKCDKNNKHGVAECEKEEILRVLKPFIVLKTIKSQQYDLKLLSDFGLTGDSSSKLLREKICRKLSLGKCNTKTLINRLNFLEIDIEELKEAINCGD